MFKDNKKINTIKLLESLKTSKVDLYKGNAFAFASKTMELIKKSVGKDSEQFRLMHSLLYNQTSARLEYEIHSADSWIVGRVKNSESFDSIIDSCIELTNSFGIYKPPTDKKNILGDMDNKIIWGIFGLVIFISYYSGVAVTNWKLNEYINPDLKSKYDQNKVQVQKGHSTTTLDSLTNKKKDIK